MGAGAARAPAEAASHPDQAWLRDLVSTLASIHRPSASHGERVAAEWLIGRLRSLGARAELEEENVHGTYWWPLGIASAAGVLAGLLALRGRRGVGGATSGLPAAAGAREG